MAKKTVYDKADKKLQKAASIVGSILVLFGALSGMYSWISSQFTNAISNQIDEFRQEVKASDAAQNLAITRLELVNLIKDDPTNVVAIEKMGRYYFGELDGDQYMTAMFSDWCNEYGTDCSIVLAK